MEHYSKFHRLCLVIVHRPSNPVEREEWRLIGNSTPSRLLLPFEACRGREEWRIVLNSTLSFLNVLRSRGRREEWSIIFKFHQIHSSLLGRFSAELRGHSEHRWHDAKQKTYGRPDGLRVAFAILSVALGLRLPKIMAFLVMNPGKEPFAGRPFCSKILLNNALWKGS